VKVLNSLKSWIKLKKFTDDDKQLLYTAIKMAYTEGQIDALKELRGNNVYSETAG
jgi:predicted lipid-binding transport protein (Tim44 family)